MGVLTCIPFNKKKLAIANQSLSNESEIKVEKAAILEDLGSHFLLKRAKHLWKGFHTRTIKVQFLAWSLIKMYETRTSAILDTVLRPV